ncbi:MAG: hypothetical protein II453_07985 [Alphaproteobacteria bacterium]|nr:hypothetical protein [Alphaproteobacteria bacterium]
MSYGFNLDKFADKDYMNQLATQITAEFFAEGRTADIVENLPANKNKATLNMFSNEATVQEGGDCSFTPDNQVDLIQKVVEVKKFKINDKLCPKNLESTYLAMMMKNNTDIPFERQLAESYIVKIKKFNEDFTWGGYDDYKGLLAQIAEDTDVIDASAEVDAAATKIAQVNAMIAKADANILASDDVRMFCSVSFYTAYVQELLAANLYIMPQTYNNGDPTKMELTIPGTTIKLTPCLGIDNTTTTKDDGEYLILTYSKNIVVSYDGVDNSEKFEMISNPYDGGNVYVTAEWGYGSAYKWGNRIVKGYTLVSES